MCNVFRRFHFVELFMSGISVAFLCSISAHVKIILLLDAVHLLMLFVRTGPLTGISFADGPNRAGVSHPHYLRTETDPVCESLCSLE
jgi:hypothetical protein